jgi:hypothetical protein
MLQLKVIPLFPSNVRGSGVVEVTKANGIWTIGFDISVLDTPVIIDLSVYEILIRNTLDDSYGRVSLAGFLASTYLATVVTGNHNVSATETYLRCQLAAAAAINLPASAARNGLDLDIKDSSGNFATNNATINPNGSELIDGKSSLVGDQNYMFIKLRPKTAGWEIIHYG